MYIRYTLQRIDEDIVEDSLVHHTPGGRVGLIT